MNIRIVDEEKWVRMILAKKRMSWTLTHLIQIGMYLDKE
jgi:hypothetical protein